MAAKVTRKGDKLQMEAWLTISASGIHKITKSQPHCEPGERRMLLRLEVPAAIFKVPELSCSIRFDGEPAQPDLVEITEDIQAMMDDAGFNARVVFEEPDNAE